MSHSRNQLQKMEATHTKLQLEFQTRLSNLIINKHPEIDKVSFQRVWTEQTKTSSKVKIFFTYSLITEGDKASKSDLTGSALLVEIQKNRWSIEDFQIEEKAIEFSEPFIIKASQ